MSESNFRKLFARYSDLSPIAYRNMLRMKRARQLLETGLYSVNEVASIVNVPDQFYFNKMFRKFFQRTAKRVYSERMTHHVALSSLTESTNIRQKTLLFFLIKVLQFAI